ncbi:MAG: extracellular solute-binding protein [Chloroflexi bacterium]|nr:MAG: extracellular solute-binding protein [Chloroflexota bacterium]
MALTRRNLFKYAGAGAATVAFADVLAACGVIPGTGGGNATGTLEIFSWWTAGGEADGLNEMYKIYKQKFPTVEIKNTAVAGGAGTDAKAVLATRMQGGKPPDSFQVHAGQELISTWVKANKMDPITQIWKDENWDATMPKDLKDIVSANGDVWSVPVNVHRGNALWYNSKLLTDNKLKPPTTFDEFFSALDTLKAAKVTAPLALGSKGNWQITMLLENNIVAVGGADFYKGLFNGKSSWNDIKVTQALGYVKTMLGYVNSDHATIDWDEADGRLSKGTSAFNIMGDWAKGYFTSINLTANKDFGAAPSPGTKGTYMIVCDTFGLPKGAPNPDAAKAWIKICGSQEGQAAFNPKKGSIPARTDVSRSIFDPIAQGFIDEFKTDQLTPSIAHGSAAPEAFASALNDEMGSFAQKKDIVASQTNIKKLADQYLTAK